MKNPIDIYSTKDYKKVEVSPVIPENTENKEATLENTLTGDNSNTSDKENKE